jgi:hypothetical protein
MTEAKLEGFLVSGVRFQVLLTEVMENWGVGVLLIPAILHYSGRADRFHVYTLERLTKRR